VAQTEDADRRTIGLDRGSGSAPYWDFVEAKNLYNLGLDLLVALTVTAPLLTVTIILVNPSASAARKTGASFWASSEVGARLATCKAAASVLACRWARADAAPV